MTIVVPAPPGGVLDLLARAMGQKLSNKWNQPVIVESKPGANFQIGTGFVAKSSPDGYTLLITPEVTFTVNPVLYRNLTYDPKKSFAPITGLVVTNVGLIANPSLAADDVNGLMEVARARPAQLNYATFGTGSTAHLHMLLLERMAEIRLTPVPYKGAAPALTDVIAGHVPLAIMDLRAALPFWKTKQVKLLGVGSQSRLAALPDVPTIAEALPGFHVSTWFGLFAPIGTPEAVLNKINGDVREVFEDTDFKTAFLGPNLFESIASERATFERFITAEEEKWRPIVQSVGLAPQ